MIVSTTDYMSSVMLPIRFFEITRVGEILSAYAFPGNDQEGITVDGEGFLYIAQDSGGIIKLKWDRER